MNKNVNEIEVIKGENNEKLTVDEKITIKELEEKIASMRADKDKKCRAAKEQLVSMLDVTIDKYRTATGTAEALRVLRFATGIEEVDLSWANRLAWDMAVEADKMHKKADKLAYAEMDKICDEFYEKEFKIEPDHDYKDSFAEYELAFEMMRIDLCRNVGGAAEDIVEFIKHTQDEIDACGEELKKLKAKEK